MSLTPSSRAKPAIAPRFEHFIDATNRGKSKTATAGQKARQTIYFLILTFVEVYMEFRFTNSKYGDQKDFVFLDDF